MKECANCGGLLDDVDVTCKYCNRSADKKEEPSYQPPHAPDPPPFDAEPERPSAGQNDTGWKTHAAPPPGANAHYGQQYQAPPGAQYGACPPHGQQYQAPPGAQYGGYPPGGQQYQAPGGYPPGSQYGGYPPPGAYRDVNRIAAGILAILLGVFGVHKFYMGRIGTGIICVIFSWTGIPAIVGLVEGILYLCMDDYTFREKYCRRY